MRLRVSQINDFTFWPNNPCDKPWPAWDRLEGIVKGEHAAQINAHGGGAWAESAVGELPHTNGIRDPSLGMVEVDILGAFAVDIIVLETWVMTSRARLAPIWCWIHARTNPRRGVPVICCV